MSERKNNDIVLRVEGIPQRRLWMLVLIFTKVKSSA